MAGFIPRATNEEPHPAEASPKGGGAILLGIIFVKIRICVMLAPSPASEPSRCGEKRRKEIFALGVAATR
jgi:hypothetical protein